MDFPQLTSNILVTHNVLQSNAMRAINQNITARNWLVGYWISLLSINSDSIFQTVSGLLQQIDNRVNEKFQSLTEKLQITANHKDIIFQTVSEKSQSKIYHGRHGRELVCFQVFAPTARQREIC